jgi:hypothetical protein
MTIAQAIDQASVLQAQIDELYQQQDKLLEPAVAEVIKRDNPNEIMQVIHKLPTGFYKSELRTFHSKRMDDDDFRRRFTEELK